MRTAKEKLEGNLAEPEEVMLLDDEAFNESLVGVTHDMRAVYDYELMAKEYAEHNGIDLIEAMDHIDSNIIRSLPYLGDKAPIVMDGLL